jgi:phthalate 4,5-dioxygenase oxygenase subunit
MISQKNNELICRVTGDAPMGRMLKDNYWFPAALQSELEAGGAPLRVQLLGERYVAFQTHDGRYGFFDEHCPHRRASLALARNEDNALRCIFHGWKYSVEGKVVEVPTEPHNQTAFCKHVPLRHFKTHVAAGIVWVWLGKNPQPFPNFEFCTVPEDQVYSVSQKLKCNWVQDVEGGLDSAHVGVLHRAWLGDIAIPQTGVDTAPVYEIEDNVAGYRYAAIRKLEGDQRYVRVNQYVMPWFAFICPEEVPEGDRLVIFSTPIDDYHTKHWMIRYNRFRPLKPSFANPADDRANWPPLPPGGPDDNWGQDRAAMAAGHFTGFGHVNTEDFAVAESQGPIVDRQNEFLNEGDRAVVELRKKLLNAVQSFIEGKQILPDERTWDYHAVKADALFIDARTDWRAASAESAQTVAP